MIEIATAQVEMDGDEQIVRLPEDFRLPGSEVRVSRSGHGLLLEPVERKMSREEIRALLDELHRLAVEHGPFMPEGREQPLVPDDDEPNPFDALP